MQLIESFETPRMSANKISPADFPDLLCMYNNPQVMKTLGGLRSAEEIQKTLAWNLQQWEDYGHGLWIFRSKINQLFIGRGGLRRIVVDGVEEIEVTYSLMPEFWEQGLGTEIASACVKIAFELLESKHIICTALVGNLASQRIMEKVGFRYEREISHSNFQQVLYRMTETEYWTRCSR